MAFREDEENVFKWSFLIVILGKNPGANMTQQLHKCVSTVNKMTWSPGRWNLLFCCSRRQLGVLPVLYGWECIWKPAFLRWLDWKSSGPDHCWQSWHQHHPLQAHQHCGCSQGVGRSFTFLASTLTTVLTAASVYSAAIYPPPFFSPAMLLTRLFCLLWGLMLGHRSWLWPK